MSLDESLMVGFLNSGVENYIKLKKNFILSKKAVLKGQNNIISKGETFISDYVFLGGDSGQIRWNTYVILGEKCSLIPTAQVKE